MRGSPSRMRDSPSLRRNLSALPPSGSVSRPSVAETTRASEPSSLDTSPVLILSRTTVEIIRPPSLPPTRHYPLSFPRPYLWHKSTMTQPSRRHSGQCWDLKLTWIRMSRFTPGTINLPTQCNSSSRCPYLTYKSRLRGLLPNLMVRWFLNRCCLPLLRTRATTTRVR